MNAENYNGFPSNKWFIYRKKRKDGTFIEIRLPNRMMFSWLKGYQLLEVVDLNLVSLRRK